MGRERRLMIQVEKGGWNFLTYYKAELRKAKVGLKAPDTRKVHTKPKLPVN